MLTFSWAFYGQWSELSSPQIAALESSTVYRGFVARRKIDSTVGVDGGKQTAPKMEHGPKSVFQAGAVPAPIPSYFVAFISRHLPTFSIPSAPRKSSRSIHSFYLRRLAFGVVFIFIYGLLDRTTVYLQIWPSISAWYPPVALSVAVLVGLGPAVIPVVVAASYLAGYIN